MYDALAIKLHPHLGPCWLEYHAMHWEVKGQFSGHSSQGWFEDRHIEEATVCFSLTSLFLSLPTTLPLCVKSITVSVGEN